MLQRIESRCRWLLAGLALVASTVRTASAQSPGDDFFAYANHDWLERTTIPPGKDRWTVRDDIAQHTRQQIDALFADASNGRAGSLARKVADFRAAYASRAAIDKRGITPLAPIFSRIEHITSRSGLAAYLGSTMRADVDPLNIGIYSSASPLGLSVEHSIHGEKTYTAFLVQGGLGLGDRDAYLQPDSTSLERRRQYRSFVAHLLYLAGFERSLERANDVIALEAALADSQATAQAPAVDRNADNRWSRAGFDRRAPGMDWGTFFDAAGLGQEREIVAWQPSAVRRVAALVAKCPLETWKDYLRFHAILDNADVLPSAFNDAAAAMRGDRRSRSDRATAETQLAMPDAIGELYARRYFSAAQKRRINRMVANVAAAFRERVSRAEWLSQKSRAVALAKLDRLYVGVGYPEHWQSWDDLVIDPNDAFANRRHIIERNRRLALARLGKPFDPHEWVMPPHTPGAVLIFQQNAYTFSAALLQPPKYDSTASDAAVYGSIGAIIAHDISHFVDVLGAEYQPDGSMRRWWTSADSVRFDSVTAPLVQQFSLYQPLPGARVDGLLTRTENVADLAGLAAAFDAHRKALPRGLSPSDVRRADREFFMAFAQSFGAKTTDAAMRAQLASDHAPEQYRMNTVRNLQAWYDAFDVRPGQRLYLEPRLRARVW